MSGEMDQRLDFEQSIPGRSKHAARDTSHLWQGEAPDVWQDRGACHNDPSWLVLGKPNTTQRGEAIRERKQRCADCTVTSDCAQWALDWVELHQKGPDKLLYGFAPQVIAGEYVSINRSDAPDIVERWRERATT